MMQPDLEIPSIRVASSDDWVVKIQSSAPPNGHSRSAVVWRDDDVHSSAHKKQQTTTATCCRKFRSSIVTLASLVGSFTVVVIGLSYAFLGSPNPFKYFESQEGLAEGNADQWETTTNHHGLYLTLENALDDKWTPYFTEYIQKWGRGGSDNTTALSLTTERVSIDHLCTSTPGRLKVCNHDYGKTDWKGINFSLIRGTYIVQSTSKMNDFYLDNDSDDEKRFSMCHEMGHGFGLAHTDENYYNKNLGNCMDYTINPTSNLNPGDFNFNILERLYGTIPTRRRGLLRGLLQQLPVDGGMKQVELPSHIMIKNHDMATKMERQDDHGDNCLDPSPCVEDLGDGYTLMAHKLLVAPHASSEHQ